MSIGELETRLESLECEMARLKARVEHNEVVEKPWWTKIVGAFEDDPDFDEIVRLGREYRESVPPPEEES